MRRAWLALGALLLLAAGVVALRTIPLGAHAFRPDSADAESVGRYGGVPLDPTSPWPKFRANPLQNGRSAVEPRDDTASGRPLPLYYSGRTEVASNASGVVTEVTVRFEEGEAPGALRAYYLVDSQPAARGAL